MPDWRSLRIDGLGPIQRLAAVFQVGPPLARLPFPSFKVKVLERADGSFVAVLNVAIRAADGSPDWEAGLGDSVEEALEEALVRFARSLGDDGILSECAFAWADAGEF
jgi:hypothetical protein